MEIKEKNLSISKLLTVSSAHVTEETFEALFLDGNLNEIRLPVYSKQAPNNGPDYGLYVYLEKNLIDWARIPKDLQPLIQLALDNGCDILCLDSDGMEIEGLPLYEWEGL